MEEKKLHELREWTKNFASKYVDPDGINFNYNTQKYYYNNENYYREYAKLLDCRSDKFDVSFDRSYEKPGLIFESKVSGKTYYLKSDQFGFSRPDEELKYPYDVYLEKVCETGSIEELEKARLNVVYWITTTREVGGSFFWPMEFKDGKYIESEYNKERGGSRKGNNRYYIDDRVDLTLFEIFQIYESGILDGTYNEDNKFLLEKNKLYYKQCFTDTMKSWLNEFEDFGEYIRFFALYSFVSINPQVVQIVPYNLLSPNEEEAFTEVIREKELFLPEISVREYEILFNRISNMVEKRKAQLLINYYDVYNKNKEKVTAPLDVREEALFRLETISNQLDEVRPNIYKYFSEGKLYYSYITGGGTIGTIDTISYDPRYEEAVREFEEKYNTLVYHVIEVHNTLTFLFVSKPTEDLNGEDLISEWEYERLAADNTLYAYIHNFDEPLLSEFGTVELTTYMGAICRAR